MVSGYARMNPAAGNDGIAAAIKYFDNCGIDAQVYSGGQGLLLNGSRKTFESEFDVALREIRVIGEVEKVTYLANQPPSVPEGIQDVVLRTFIPSPV